jgi:hypothetical protein
MPTAAHVADEVTWGSGQCDSNASHAVFQWLGRDLSQIFLSRISALIHFSPPGVNLEAKV